MGVTIHPRPAIGDRLRRRTTGITPHLHRTTGIPLRRRIVPTIARRVLIRIMAVRRKDTLSTVARRVPTHITTVHHRVVLHTTAVRRVPGTGKASEKAVLRRLKTFPQGGRTRLAIDKAGREQGAE